MTKFLAFMALLFCLAPAAMGQEAAADNAEMATIFDADQAVRTGWKPENAKDTEFIKRMIADDLARRKRTAELLESGDLATANDFYRAAFVYQHGGDPSSYLIAHTLAVAAAARGHEKAAWIAAASLDRYLQSIGQPQIYGTQTTAISGSEPTKDPFDRTLIPDSLRTILGVPTLAEQDERLRQSLERMRQ